MSRLPSSAFTGLDAIELDDDNARDEHEARGQPRVAERAERRLAGRLGRRTILRAHRPAAATIARAVHEQRDDDEAEEDPVAEHDLVQELAVRAREAARRPTGLEHDRARGRAVARMQARGPRKKSPSSAMAW